MPWLRDIHVVGYRSAVTVLYLPQVTFELYLTAKVDVVRAALHTKDSAGELTLYEHVEGRDSILVRVSP
jgi:hypothetical protein